MNKQNKADILIRGWDVPKGCDSCQLNANGRGCTITGTQYEGDTWVMMDFDEHAERLPDCPLVELPEHGDLIDRDAFRAENEYYLNREFINPKYEDTLDDLLKDAPVVIPSNKEV